MSHDELVFALVMIGLFMLVGVAVCLIALSYIDEDTNPRP